jgi:hypothetical protein
MARLFQSFEPAAKLIDLVFMIAGSRQKAGHMSFHGGHSLSQLSGVLLKRRYISLYSSDIALNGSDIGLEGPENGNDYVIDVTGHTSILQRIVIRRPQKIADWSRFAR